MCFVQISRLCFKPNGRQPLVSAFILVGVLARDESFDDGTFVSRVVALAMDSAMLLRFGRVVPRVGTFLVVRRGLVPFLGLCRVGGAGELFGILDAFQRYI